MSSVVQRFWVCTASREHVQTGVLGGFAQACHGKRSALSKMQEGDGIVYYSPTTEFKGKTKCQNFTAIGKIADQNIYAVEMFPGFRPFRRNVTYFKCQETSIRPMLSILEFTSGKSNWGIMFRRGVFEISMKDFKAIEEKLIHKGE